MPGHCPAVCDDPWDNKTGSPPGTGFDPVLRPGCKFDDCRTRPVIAFTYHKQSVGNTPKRAFKVGVRALTACSDHRTQASPGSLRRALAPHRLIPGDAPTNTQECTRVWNNLIFAWFFCSVTRWTCTVQNHSDERLLVCCLTTAFPRPPAFLRRCPIRPCSEVLMKPRPPPTPTRANRSTNQPRRRLLAFR